MKELKNPISVLSTYFYQQQQQIDVLGHFTEWRTSLKADKLNGNRGSTLSSNKAQAVAMASPLNFNYLVIKVGHSFGILHGKEGQVQEGLP